MNFEKNLRRLLLCKNRFSEILCNKNHPQPKVASIFEIRDRIKLFTENLTKFQILAIEADSAGWRKRVKIRNFVKFLVSQLIRPHCSASDATLEF